MDTEQAQAHSEPLATDVEKLVSMMDEEGNLPAHGEDLDEVEETEESPAAPQKDAEEPAKPREPESKDQPELVDVEHDGKTYKVPADLKDAFLRQSDYTRKTQDIAKERAAAQQERQVLQRLTQQASQIGEYQAALKQIDSQLEQFQRVDWNQLYATDRTRYLELRQAATELQQSRQNIVGQGHAFLQQVQAYEAQKHQEAVQAGLSEVRKVIPDFGPEHQKALVETALSLGLKPEETAQIIDPRIVLGLNELKTLREKVAQYESKQTAAAKQVKSAPQMVRPQAPSQQTGGERNEAAERLKRTGSVEDAADALNFLFSQR